MPLHGPSMAVAHTGLWAPGSTEHTPRNEVESWVEKFTTNHCILPPHPQVRSSVFVHRNEGTVY